MTTTQSKKVGSATEPCGGMEGGVVVKVLASDSGKPLGSGWVQLTGPTTIRKKTNDAGQVSFSDIEPGTYEVTLGLSNRFLRRYLAPTADPVSVEMGQLVPVMVQADPISPATLKVNVVRIGSGDPVPKAIVRLLGPTSEQESADSNGSAQLSQLLPGNYSVAVRLPGNLSRAYNKPSPQEITLASGANETITIELEYLLSSLQLTLRREDSKIVVTDSIPIQIRGRSPQTQNTNAKGIATFDELRPGTYDITARIPTDLEERYEAVEQQVDLKAGQTIKTDVFVKWFQWLEYRLVDSEGRPLRKARVRLKGKQTMEKTSDAEGWVRFTKLPPGSYQIESIETQEPTVLQQINS